MTQKVEILSCGWQGVIYHAMSIYLLMIWWCKEAGHGIDQIILEFYGLRSVNDLNRPWCVVVSSDRLHRNIIIDKRSSRAWHIRQFLLALLQNNAFFSCDQAALWMVQSVRLSVRPSVCLSVRPSVCLSHLFDYVPIILSSWNFQELLPVTKVTSMQKVKVRGQRSRSQRSQPNLTVSGL